MKLGINLDLKLNKAQLKHLEDLIKAVAKAEVSREVTRQLKFARNQVVKE